MIVLLVCLVSGQELWGNASFEREGLCVCVCVHLYMYVLSYDVSCSPLMSRKMCTLSNTHSYEDHELHFSILSYFIADFSSKLSFSPLNSVNNEPDFYLCLTHNSSACLGWLVETTQLCVHCVYTLIHTHAHNLNS